MKIGRVGALSAFALLLVIFLILPAQASLPTKWHVNGNGYVGLLVYTVNPTTMRVSGTLLGTPCEGYMVGRRLVLHRYPQGKSQLWEGWIMDPRLGAAGQPYYRGRYFIAGTISENKANNSLYPWYGVPADGTPPPWSGGGGGTVGGGTTGGGTGGGTVPGNIYGGRGYWVSSLHRRTYPGNNLPFNWRVVLQNPVPNMVRTNLPDTNWGCANCEKFFSTIVVGRPTSFAYKYASDNTAMLYVNGQPVANHSFANNEWCTGKSCCNDCCDGTANCNRIINAQGWQRLNQSTVNRVFNTGRNVITWRVRQNTGGSGFHCLLRLAGARVVSPQPGGGGTVGGGTTGGSGSGGVQGGNLLRNPSFEQGTPAGNWKVLGRGSTELPGWTIGGHSVDVVQNYWQSSHGHRSLDMHGSGVGSVSQGFNTVPGRVYRVSFDMAGNTDGGSKTKTMIVEIRGLVKKTFSFNTTGKTRQRMGWVRRSFTFRAKYSRSILSFIAVKDPSGYQYAGPALDNVSVYAAGSGGANVGGGGATVGGNVHCTIVGKWKWFTGSQPEFLSGGKVTGSTNSRWYCKDASRGIVIIEWNNRQYIDTLALSRNGTHLDGKNQHGTHVWGDKITGSTGSGGGTAVGGNLLRNPSFEQGRAAGRFITLGRGSKDLPGWSLAGASIDVVGTYWPASHGKRSLDMFGSGLGNIAQAFATVPGRSYRVSFDMAGNPDCGGKVKKLMVGIDGVVQKAFSFSTAGKSRSHMGWVRKSFTFLAKTNRSVLRFVAVKDPSGDIYCGPTLDNTAVQQIGSGGGTTGGGTTGGGTAQSGNLFVNPSFEQGRAAGRFITLSTGSRDLPGWSVGGKSIDVVGTYWRPSHGKRSVDVFGSGRGMVGQTVRTIPGRTYRISFDMAGNPECGGKKKYLRVEVVGVGSRTFTFNTQGRSFTNMGWIRRSFDFKAKSTATAINFIALADPKGDIYCGPTLDNTAVYLIGGGASTGQGDDHDQPGLNRFGGAWDMFCVSKKDYLFRLVLSQNGSAISGSMTRTNGSEAVTQVKGRVYADGRVQFTRRLNNWTQDYTGRVVRAEGGKALVMEGTFSHNGAGSWPWQAAVQSLGYFKK